MGKNWKTTVAGIITSAASFVNFQPSLFHRWPWVVAAAGWTAAGGLIMLGLASKDYNTHSTETEVIQSQQKQDAAAVDSINKKP